MRLPDFIQVNLDAIIVEWEAFARTLLPAAKPMSDLALRNHSREILLAIVGDMQKVKTDVERLAKSRQVSAASETIAAATANNKAIPMYLTNKLANPDPATAPAVPPSAITPNSRCDCCTLKMSAMKLQKTDTTKRLNTLIHTKNTRATCSLPMSKLSSTQKIALVTTKKW